MNLNINVSNSFKELFTTELNEIVLSGGRASGKTKITAILSTLILLKNHKADGIIARANYGSLSSSSFNELCVQIQSLGEQIANLFEFKKNPLRIIKKSDGSTIYFAGYGGSNMSRTKGIKTLNPVRFVIFEEAQELNNKENLDQAKASFRRNYGSDVKQFVLFNPPPFKAHWINLYYQDCLKDSKILTKHVTYKDVWNYLNDFDKRAIIKEKILNYDNYRYMYLGEPVGGAGLVYPMVKEDMIINLQQFQQIILRGVRPVALVIGVDGAVNNDCTSCVPFLILNNGQVVISRIFYHNPKINGVIGSHVLVQNQIRRWFNNLLQFHDYDHIKMPIYIRCDSAATDLIQELNFFLGDRANVSRIKKGSILEMVSNVQSALSNEMIYILDEGFYYDYLKNVRVPIKVNLLYEQLSLLVWNDQQNGYNPAIPNDVSDAFTYGARFYFGNIENISWFNILDTKSIDYVKIKEIIGRSTQ